MRNWKGITTYDTVVFSIKKPQVYSGIVYKFGEPLRPIVVSTSTEMEAILLAEGGGGGGSQCTRICELGNTL